MEYALMHYLREGLVICLKKKQSIHIKMQMKGIAKAVQIALAKGYYKHYVAVKCISFVLTATCTIKIQMPQKLLENLCSPWHSMVG